MEAKTYHILIFQTNKTQNAELRMVRSHKVSENTMASSHEHRSHEVVGKCALSIFSKHNVFFLRYAFLLWFFFALLSVFYLLQVSFVVLALLA